MSRSISKSPVLGNVGKAAGGIPRGPMYKGLKMPKEKGPDQIQKRLQKKSPWYNSILDPLHGADCKIPDETGVETGTLQCLHRVNLTADSGGVVGLVMNNPYPKSSSGTPDPNFYLVNGTSSTSTNILWESTGRLLDSTQPLLDYAASTRIVSAAVTVQSEASLAFNQGVYTTYAAPFVPLSSTEDFPRSGNILDFVQNHYKSAIIPVNNNRPAMVRWYPFARDELSFKDFISTSSENDVGYHTAWPLMILGTGLAPNSVHQFQIIVNYEFVPQTNAINILDAAPSPKDATEVDLVENWVQTMDVGTMTSSARISSSPSTVSPSHEDDATGFGMFANVVSEILPYALALL